MNLGTDGVLEAVNRSTFREVLKTGFGVDELEVILASRHSQKILMAGL